jgi:hypothetical protein
MILRARIHETRTHGKTFYFSGWSEADNASGTYHPYTPWRMYAKHLTKTEAEKIRGLFAKELGVPERQVEIVKENRANRAAWRGY